MHNAGNNNMKEKMVYLTLLVLCLLTFTSCDKCVTNNLGDVNFSEVDKKIIPYNGTETLIFKDSIGDSICYKPSYQGYSDYYIKWHQKYYEQYQCEPDFYNEEHIEAHFVNQEHNAFIFVSLGLSSQGGTILNKGFGLEVCYTDTEYWGFIGSYKFDLLKLYQKSSISNNSVVYNDSLFVGSKKFYSVHTLIQDSSTTNSGNLKKVFYNITKGVIGFETEFGHLWYLKN